MKPNRAKNAVVAEAAGVDTAEGAGVAEADIVEVAVGEGAAIAVEVAVVDIEEEEDVVIAAAVVVANAATRRTPDSKAVISKARHDSFVPRFLFSSDRVVCLCVPHVAAA